MASFDFIVAKDFRQSLESDYAEMVRAIEVGSWKSAQVVAGSIVEALLIDHLASVPNPARPKKDVLRLDLAEAISICLDEKVLTTRTADLCSVIRSYRNLIHPGRVARLGEPAPGKESANIALSLVEIITDELTRSRRAQMGLTAGQIVSKIQRDEQVLSFLKHLVLEAGDQQRELLLIELIPAAHEQAHNPDDFLNEVQDRLEAAYATTFEEVSDAVKARAAGEFVRLLREADGDYVTRYADAFFRASHLTYVPDGQRQMVIGYLLGRATVLHTFGTLRLIHGICPFLGPQHASSWLDPLLKTFFAAKVSPGLQEKIREHVSVAIIGTPKRFDDALFERFKDWHRRFAHNAEKRTLLQDLQDDMVPF